MLRWGGFVPCLDAANLTIRLHNYDSRQGGHCVEEFDGSSKDFGLIAGTRQLKPANAALDH